jgi:putative ABC transport system ATP-binding protein
VALLREFAAENGRSVVMVTHDNRIIDKADRIMSMVDGRIVSDVMVQEAITVSQYLRKVDLLQRLSTAELSSVAEKMQSCTFGDGEILIRQGEEGDQFFLLGEGEAEVLVNGTVVARLQAGQYFGERALITGETRNATVVGRSHGRVYVLGKDEFTAALNMAPELKDELKQLYFSR